MAQPSGQPQAMTSTEVALPQPEPEHPWQMTWRLAQRAATTRGMVPPDLFGKPEELLMILLAGQEIGLGPIQTMSHIYTINGRVGFKSELLRGRILQFGHHLEVLEYRDDKVVVRGTRRDGARLAVDWDMARAETAGLLKRNSETWAKYPRQMLLARATSELARALFPDCTVGLLSYTPDELQEGSQADDISPYELLDVDPDTGEIIDLPTQAAGEGSPDEPMDTDY